MNHDQQLVLTMCASPRSHHVEQLCPDETGALQDVSRQEAKDRGLDVYVGSLSTLDKPYRIQGGSWGAIRFVVNGNTAGQARLNKLIKKLREEK